MIGSENMKYVGEKQPNIEYRKRPGAYVILERDNDNKIGIIAVNEDYFLLGGGIEKGETQLEALKREALEESGYTLKDIKKFDEVGSYLYSMIHKRIL